MLKVVKTTKDNKDYFNLFLVIEYDGYTYHIPLKPVFELKQYTYNAYRKYLFDTFNQQNTK